MRDIVARVLRARACAYACVRTGVCACACACAYRGACPPGLSDRSLWRLCVLQPSRRSEEHAAFYSRQDLSNRSLQRLKPTDPIGFCFDAARPCLCLPAAALCCPVEVEQGARVEARKLPKNRAANRARAEARHELHEARSMPQHAGQTEHGTRAAACPTAGRVEGTRAAPQLCTVEAQRAQHEAHELPAVGRGRGAQPAGPWARGLQGLCRTGAVRMSLPAYMPLWASVIDSAGRSAPLRHSAPCTSKTAAVTHSVGLQRQNTRHTSCTHCRAVGCVPRSRAAASARACNHAASACVFASVGRCGAFCALFMRPVARGHRHEQNGPQQALQGLTEAKRHELHELQRTRSRAARGARGARAARIALHSRGARGLQGRGAVGRLSGSRGHSRGHTSCRRNCPQLVEVEGVGAVIEAHGSRPHSAEPYILQA